MPADPPLDAPTTLREMFESSHARATTPDEALRELMLGNARFFRDEPSELMSLYERRALKYGQRPFVAILGCADSRAPAEALFDQRPGDVFNVRLAGNVVTPEALGSLEYAVAVLGVVLIVVMGHEGCGAVTAAMAPDADREALSPDLQALIGRIRPAVADLPVIADRKARERVAVIENVRHQMRALGASDGLVEAVADGRVGIVGGYYELRSGVVEFLESPDAEPR